jgi:hypothetical protein
VGWVPPTDPGLAVTGNPEPGPGEGDCKKVNTSLDESASYDGCRGRGFRVCVRDIGELSRMEEGCHATSNSSPPSAMFAPPSLLVSFCGIFDGDALRT